MSLVSASEMLALRQVAESGMTTAVAIYNRTIEQTDDGQRDAYPATPSSTALGWLYEQTGAGADLGILSGREGIAEGFRLLLPVETVIASGDKAVIGGHDYYVSHANEDNTHLPVLNCAVRRMV